MDGFELSLGNLCFRQNIACGEIDIMMGIVGIELCHGLFMFVDIEWVAFAEIIVGVLIAHIGASLQYDYNTIV
jgi:hypothetical protein